VKRLSGATTTISCENGTIASDSASLINTDEVQAEGCNFSCSQITGDPYSVPIVSFEFTVKEKVAGLFESQSSAAFKSSVSLRNFSP
jgi:hypothetical protein